MTTTTTTKKVEQAAHEGIDKTRNLTEKAADKTKELAGTVAEKAKDATSVVIDKTKDAANYVAEGTSDLANAAVEKADNAAAATGSGMQTLADTIRKNTPDDGMIGAASNKLAETLETGGKYLEEQGLTGLGEDITNLVKRYPIGSLVVGVGIGYILARATSRS